MSEIQDRLVNDIDFRMQVCEWLMANGIDPAYVPEGARASIVDGQLTMPIKVASAKGRDFVGLDFPDAVMTTTKTVPVVVEPNADVQLWLQPKCEACGR